MTKILADYPAYRIISPESNLLVHGETFMVPFTSIRNSNEMIWREFAIGSVVSYSIAHKECPINAIDRARKLGHELHWVYGCGVSITAHKRAKETKKGFNFGDIIQFEGRKFELVKAPNSNVGLKEITE